MVPLLIFHMVFSVYAQTCIEFSLPKPGVPIFEPYCTIAVTSTCPAVSRVEFSAEFIPQGAQTAVTQLLGAITRPPYKMKWRIGDIPDQHYRGMTIIARAEIPGAADQYIRREGIFPLRKSLQRTKKIFPYSYAGFEIPSTYTYSFNNTPAPIDASVWLMWNEKELSITIDVNDSSFLVDDPAGMHVSSGVEILLAPGLNRNPFPDESTVSWFIPLSGPSQRRKFKPQFNEDGRFEINAVTRGNNHEYSVEMFELSGYTINLQVPREVFGNVIPDILGCNVLLKIATTDGATETISLVDGSRYEMYSPAFWYTFHRKSKPFFLWWPVLWSAFFLLGLIVTLALYSLVSRLRKKDSSVNIGHNEEDKKLFEQIHLVVDEKLIQKDFSLQAVVDHVGVDKSKSSRFIKRMTGMSFQRYLMHCRVKLAQERLRSSKSSEAAIADLCGFADVNEMEKYFMKFCRTTPYKFRTEQQIT